MAGICCLVHKHALACKADGINCERTATPLSAYWLVARCLFSITNKQTNKN